MLYLGTTLGLETMLDGCLSEERCLIGESCLSEERCLIGESCLSEERCLIGELCLSEERCLIAESCLTVNGAAGNQSTYECRQRPSHAVHTGGRLMGCADAPPGGWKAAEAGAVATRWADRSR
eukprot:356396-Chlamydomonas_euryale.AAC.3